LVNIRFFNMFNILNDLVFIRMYKLIRQSNRTTKLDSLLYKYIRWSGKQKCIKIRRSSTNK